MHRGPGARQPHVRQALTAGAAVAAVLVAAVPAQAQRQSAGAEGRTVWLQSSLNMTETVTSNGDPGGSAGKQRDAVTQVTPSVRLVARGGRVRADIDYSPTALIYARERENSEIQNTLNAVVNAELLDDRAFIAGTASIAQRTVSAFGTQSGRNNLANDNRSEVATVSLAPSLRGNIAGIVDYSATASVSATRAASSDAGDSNAGSVSAFLGGGRGLFGWTVQGQRNVDEFSAGRSTTQDSATARLIWQPVYDFRAALIGGREWTDVQSEQRQGNGRYGVSADWQPSDRTQLSVIGEKRYFGHSHSISLLHRRQRSVWSYIDTRDATSGPQQSATATVTLSQLLAGVVPDQAQREALIRSQGLDPNAQANYGLLLASVSEQRQQTLSVAYTGLRATVSLSAFRSDTRRLDRITSVFDDLSLADRVRQQGVTLGVSHRLTPTASLGAAASLLRTLNAGTVAGNEQRVVTLTWSDQIGARTNVSLGLRHSQAEGSSTNSYNETAAYGSLYIRF